MEANEYITTNISSDVEDWYAVEADVTWYIDGVEYGWDKKELHKLWKKVDQEEFDDRIVDSNFEDRKYTFIVYKLNGEWYVYHPYFIRMKFYRGLEFEVIDSNS